MVLAGSNAPNEAAVEFFARFHRLSDVALLALRLVVGTSFLIHGWKKLAMWKTQPSERLPGGLLSTLRLLSVAEPLGGAAIVVGFLTQAAAVGFALVMLGAIRLKAFQMHKRFSGEGGWEFELTVLAAAIVLLVFGAGGLSLDHLVWGL